MKEFKNNKDFGYDSEIQKLFDERIHLFGIEHSYKIEIEALSTAMFSIMKRSSNKTTVDELKVIIENIRGQLNSVGILLETINNKINEYQNTCDHDFIEDGRDSHYDYLKCVKCGFTKKDV